ncbi:MAG: YggT family protein [Acidiferrobacterales bacterium]|nr:YggT family protein [Acidiferrobacterales bacterium]
MPHIQNGASLVIEVLLGLFLLALVLRFLFQLLRVEFRNPLCQAIVKVTNPVLLPLRRFIPGFWGIDMASVVMILLVGAIKFYALTAVAGYQAGPLQSLFFGLTETLNLICWILLIAIIGSVIISWVAPHSHHPAIQILTGISRPVLAPIRRIIPSFGGLDITPIFALLAIQLVQTTGIPLMIQLFQQIGLV